MRRISVLHGIRLPDVYLISFLPDSWISLMRYPFGSLAVVSAAILLAGAFAPTAASQSSPSDVAIYVAGSFSGNGVLISPSHVLTTGKLVGSPTAVYSVVAGSSTLGGGTSVSVAGIARHPNYDPPANDLAVITLATPFTLSESIQPATLAAPLDGSFAGVTATVSGWWTQGCPGSLSGSSAILPMTVITNAEAKLTWGDLTINDGHVCLSDVQDTPGTQAIGSGIYAAGKLIGIYSFGGMDESGCMDASYPVVGTRVSYFKPWVDIQVGPVSSPYVNLGNWKPGTGGQSPMLLGSGPATAGSLTTLELINAKPNSDSYLFWGLSLGNVPFKGGILVPGGFGPPTKLPIGPTGTSSLSYTFPSGAAGFSVYLQHWVVDAGATSGLSASNGLKVTVQP
jgi:hypothetical protein